MRSELRLTRRRALKRASWAGVALLFVRGGGALGASAARGVRRFFFARVCGLGFSITSNDPVTFQRSAERWFRALFRVCTP